MSWVEPNALALPADRSGARTVAPTTTSSRPPRSKRRRGAAVALTVLAFAFASAAIYGATFEVRYRFGTHTPSLIGTDAESDVPWTSCGSYVSPHWRTRVESDMCYGAHDGTGSEILLLTGAAVLSAVAAAIAWRRPRAGEIAPTT